MMNLYFTALEIVSFKTTTRNTLSWVSTQPDDLRAKLTEGKAAAWLHLFPKCLLQKICHCKDIFYRILPIKKNDAALYQKKKKKTMPLFKPSASVARP